jgi:hypothetical protein
MCAVTTPSSKGAALVKGPAGPSAAARDSGNFRCWWGSDQPSRGTGALPSGASWQASGPICHHWGRSERPDHRAVAPELDQYNSDVDACWGDRRPSMVMAHRSYALYACGFYAVGDLQASRAATQADCAKNAFHISTSFTLSGCVLEFLDASVRTGWSEPSGATCMPDGVSPSGLDAGAPPIEFPCGCVTSPLGSVLFVANIRLVMEGASAHESIGVHVRIGSGPEPVRSR